MKENPFELKILKEEKGAEGDDEISGKFETIMAVSGFSSAEKAEHVSVLILNAEKPLSYRE